MLGRPFSVCAAFAAAVFDALSFRCRLARSAATAERKVDVGSLSKISLGTPANPEYSRPSAVLVNGMFIQSTWGECQLNRCECIQIVFTAMRRFFFFHQIRIRIKIAQRPWAEAAEPCKSLLSTWRARIPRDPFLPPCPAPPRRWWHVHGKHRWGLSSESVRCVR